MVCFLSLAHDESVSHMLDISVVLSTAAMQATTSQTTKRLHDDNLTVKAILIAKVMFAGYNMHVVAT